MEERDASKRSLINRLRNKIRALLRTRRKEWALEVLESAPATPSGFWKAVNKISGLTRSFIPTLAHLDTIAVSDDRKADLLSNVFRNNFSASIFPHPVLERFSPPALDIGVVTHHIRRAISKMRASAPGCDEIPPAFIKALKDELAMPIAALLLKCLETGTFPDCLKIARVAPIPKVANASNPEEFRPISVTPALSKVLEYWLLEQLRPYIQPHDLQFGFRQNSGTDCALLTLQHQVAVGLDSCPKAARALVISFDVYRAFDQINHNVLIAALQRREVPAFLLAIIASFLADRFQFVQVGTARSGREPVVSGVCQGTVLGPFLFNVVVDQIFSSASLSTGATIIMYADDLCYMKPLSGTTSEQEAQRDVDQLISLYHGIGLQINPSKSHLLLVRASNKASTAPVIQIDGTPIAAVDSLRYLGVTLDPHLSFGLHARVTAAKVKRQLGAAYRTIGQWVPANTFLSILKQKLLPQLTYALPVVATSHKSDWRQVEGVQRFGLRLISNDYLASYSDLLRRFQMVPIAQIYFHQAAVAAYKLVNGLRHCPVPIFSQFSDNSVQPRRSERLALRERNSSRRLIKWNFARTGQHLLEICSYLPVYRLVSIWNDLDDHCISFGLSKFRQLTSSSTDLFDRLCNKLLYRNIQVFGVFREM